ALEQDREATDRQVQDRLQRAAELAARTMDQQLASWQQFRTDGVSLETAPVLKVTPRQHVAYEPGGPIAAQPSDPALAEAMQYEQVRGNIEAAIPLYRRTAETGGPRLRAAALERLAACYRKIGMPGKAMQAYRELLKFPDQRIGFLNAELIARFELCALREGDREAFYHDLVAGRWGLDKARYLFYSETAREWAGAKDPARAVERGKLALSAAIEDYLENRRRVLPGYLAFSAGNETLMIPAANLRSRLERFATLDNEIRIKLAEVSAPRPSLAAFHPLADRELPWLVEAVPLDAARLYAGAGQSRTIYLTMLLLVFALLMVGSYMTARAVKHELEVVRLKSDFVSTVSHEFRSPLTAIRQLSELLQRGRVPTEEKRQEYYALISRESGRLSRLVENLLDFSRMEDGRKQYHFDRLETADWLRELASGFGRTNVTLSMPPELPPILGDRVALTSAVDNLLDNAVKYSPAGAPVVCEAEADGQELTIRVRDRGYGITAEDRDHVFEKFYRGNGEISRQVKGAGVGLSLVRQIVEAHGGRVDFDSRVGEGSVFRIRLRTA
ncbi:MAG TPA: HAMP domain-containing sensor histidine kinase, partial [Bryobacteraceae bacterium]|nr:HAMP domain-containing sensor histidine kinase [Bryobacteraceae bacterium]